MLQDTGPDRLSDHRVSEAQEALLSLFGSRMPAERNDVAVEELQLVLEHSTQPGLVLHEQDFSFLHALIRM